MKLLAIYYTWIASWYFVCLVFSGVRYRFPIVYIYQPIYSLFKKYKHSLKIVMLHMQCEGEK